MGQQQSRYAAAARDHQPEQRELQRERADAEQRLPAERLQPGQERGEAAVQHQRWHAECGEHERQTPRPRHDEGPGREQDGGDHGQRRLPPHDDAEERARRAGVAAAHGLGRVASHRRGKAEAEPHCEQSSQPQQERVAARVVRGQVACDEHGYEHAEPHAHDPPAGHGREVTPELAGPAPGFGGGRGAHTAPARRRAASTSCCESRGPSSGKLAAARRSHGGTSPSRRRSTGCERLLMSRDTA